MTWRVARSLDQLLAQINTAYPDRSKVADGAIGDTAHAASVSDHNPDAAGVVRARDYTHDPANGFDAHAMADRIVASHDPRIKYVISRGRIASATISPWTWRTYIGTNRHDHHAHVSVVADSRADYTNPWTITTATQEDEVTPEDIKTIAKAAADEVLKRPVRDLAGNEVTVGAAIGYSLRNTQAIAALEKASVDKIATAVATKVGAGASADDIAKALLIQLTTKETS